ncbi:MAG: signal peptide peptidase SppA [Desulfovermiculus sp.]|nr:signal peptide peptidase SppA [Desulfovermiculus sp.]
MTNRFSQRHPLLFGLFLVFAAVVLTFGAMAFFSALRSGDIGWFASKVGIVHIQGTILDSRPTTDWIHRLDEDESVQAILLRIDSPGGVVAPSQEIYAAIRRLAQNKPVIASMGAVAASGGYYIACAADQIVANPGTITGSIGVKAQLMSIEDLLQRLGIKDRTVTSGRLKDAGSPTQAMSQEERAYFQKLVDDLHEQFVLAVAQGRNMQVEKVRELADGRAYTGQQAKKSGLVDSLGGMQSALDRLRDMAGITGRVTYVEGPEEPFSLLSWILGLSSEWLGRKTVTGQQAVFSYIYLPQSGQK